jgi:hypothetical protein
MDKFFGLWTKSRSGQANRPIQIEFFWAGKEFICQTEFVGSRICRTEFATRHLLGSTGQESRPYNRIFNLDIVEVLCYPKSWVGRINHRASAPAFSDSTLVYPLATDTKNMLGQYSFCQNLELLLQESNLFLSFQALSNGFEKN